MHLIPPVFPSFSFSFLLLHWRSSSNDLSQLSRDSALLQLPYRGHHVVVNGRSRTKHCQPCLKALRARCARMHIAYVSISVGTVGVKKAHSLKQSAADAPTTEAVAPVFEYSQCRKIPVVWSTIEVCLVQNGEQRCTKGRLRSGNSCHWALARIHVVQSFTHLRLLVT